MPFCTRAESQPGSLAAQAKAQAMRRQIAISNALGSLAVGQAHVSLAYQPVTEHFERARLLLRTKMLPVVADTF